MIIIWPPNPKSIWLNEYMSVTCKMLFNKNEKENRKAIYFNFNLSYYIPYYEILTLIPQLSLK